MRTNGDLLRSVLSNTADQIRRRLPEHEARQARGPNQWSRKQIIGHLIDSANNNHRRFVMANLQDNLVFDGYRQEEWVALQQYQEGDWIQLVDLWECYNLHLAWLVDQLPESVRLKTHSIHSLDAMAWKTVPKHKPTTLDYLIRDYIGHLEHHVKQILPEYQPEIIGTYEAHPGEHDSDV